MKRVLHVTSSLRKNGTETFIMNVFRGIDRSKVMFDFLLLEQVDDGYEQEARELGARLYYYPSRRKGLSNYRRALKDFFKEHGQDYDAVHLSGNSFTEIYPLSLARDYGIATRVTHSHNTSTAGWHNKLLHHINKKRLHKVANVFLACSRGAKEWGYGGTRNFEKSEVIPNGIDLSKYAFNSEKRKKFREENSISESTFVVAHTGAFREVKNHPFLIDIFAEIVNIRPDSLLLLCGDGGNRSEIEVKVREKGLSDKVKFLGIRSDVDRILSASDAYVFPSFYEGLPFALVEAQASGIDTYVSDKVSDEVKLTDNFKFLRLEQTPRVWALEILKSAEHGRTAGNSPRLKDYDIATTCARLMQIYTNKE